MVLDDCAEDIVKLEREASNLRHDDLDVVFRWVEHLIITVADWNWSRTWWTVWRMHRVVENAVVRVTACAPRLAAVKLVASEHKRRRLGGESFMTLVAVTSNDRLD